MKVKLNNLNEKITVISDEKRMVELAQQERDAQLNSTVPDKFVRRMKVIY